MTETNQNVGKPTGTLPHGRLLNDAPTCGSRIEYQRSNTNRILTILFSAALSLGTYAFGIQKRSEQTGVGLVSPSTLRPAKAAVPVPSQTTEDAPTSERQLEPISRRFGQYSTDQIAESSTGPAHRDNVIPSEGGEPYHDCSSASKDGMAPLHRGDPRYNEGLDHDGDGVACETYYKSCKDVRNAGKAPLLKGQDGYRPGLDRDGDGRACEPTATP